MRYVGIACLLASAVIASASPAAASSLQVSPVLIDMTVPAAASSVSLRNAGDKPINAQVRVFRWSTVAGKEQLTPTTDVVASPPMLNMAPNADAIVRIVRTAKAPVSGEESYRLIVDELPSTAPQQAGTVAMNIRYSIPVFFKAATVSPPSVTWTATRQNRDLILTASNGGDRRLRVAGLIARDAGGNVISFGRGLNGYVLGRSSTTWVAPGGAAKITGSNALTIAAQGDLGPINAQTKPIQ